MPQSSESFENNDWGKKAYVRTQPTPEEVIKKQKRKRKRHDTIVDKPKTISQPKQVFIRIPVKPQQPQSFAFSRGTRVRYVPNIRY
jgi:hypothetical protein